MGLVDGGRYVTATGLAAGARGLRSVERDRHSEQRL
jgi:hypothetical protein